MFFMIKFGYYNSKLPFGDKGDFITAPKISNLFSGNDRYLVSFYLGELWKTEQF